SSLACRAGGEGAGARGGGASMGKREKAGGHEDAEAMGAGLEGPKRRRAEEEPAAQQGRGGGRGAGRGAGRGGRGAAGEAARPSALEMFRPGKGRKYTMSVALPASVLDNAQSGELKALLVGQIARALTIFAADEVVLYEDRSDTPRSEDDQELSKSMAFFARNLQYLETPQYLRRQLLPMHKEGPARLRRKE
ncbi:unnamed protein product, partial [Prorocentrum cordatum]